MPFIESRFLSRANWRNMNRRCHADDESAEVLLIGTNDCWKNGTCIPGIPSSTEPTISEFFALNQFTQPFTTIVGKYNGPQKSACGFISVANALVLCEEISQQNMWDRSITPNEVQSLLDAVSNPDKVMPKVENALHFIATERVNYILNNSNASASLKASPKQQNLFLSNWAAPFELSDCVRRYLKLAMCNNNNNNNNNDNNGNLLVTAQEAAAKKSPFGPSPFPINSDISILRNSNSNDNKDSSSSSSSQPVAFLSNSLFMRTNLFPIQDNAKELQKIRIEQEDKRFGGVASRTQPGVITYNTGDSAFFVDVLASDENNRNNNNNNTTTTAATPSSSSKFVSPRTILDQMQRPSSPLFPPPKGCRVYIVDVIGHFCVLLCYLDASGTPHGVVINSASGDLSDMHRKPTVRVAFDIYVANVTDGFRGDFSQEERNQKQQPQQPQEDSDGTTSPVQMKNRKNDEMKKSSDGSCKEDAIELN